MRSRVANALRQRRAILARTPHNLGVGIIAAKGHRLHRPLAGTVVDLQKARFQVPLQGLPVIPRIADRLADRTLGQDPLLILVVQPLLQLLQDRPRLLLAQGVTLRVVQALLPGLFLDFVQQADPRQGLVGPWRIGGPGFVELPPGVHPAPDLLDLAVGEQGVISRVRVGLQIALVSLEHLLRSLACERRSENVARGGRKPWRPVS
jgi:hypothetical protein